jgi:hypothetical protein
MAREWPLTIRLALYCRVEWSGGEMSDPFLIVTGVGDERGAMTESLKSALQQRQNTVYSRPEFGDERAGFRDALSQVIRSEAARYRQPSRVPDAEHCEAIRRISDGLSNRFGHIFLTKRRFRYGTAQKAFNLYLKFLWRLGALRAGRPPHCPVDGVVLGAAGLVGKWTHSDDQQEYMRWIDGIRKVALPLDLSDWEYGIWQRQQIVPLSTRCG